MELRHLEIFVKIYDCGSFSKAADALCLSQPTISVHMRNLEEVIQKKLFDRLGRDIVPTQAGELLYRYARDIVRIKEEARRALDQLDETLRGTLAVGGSTVPGEYLLPAVIKRFREQFSEIMLTLRIGNSNDIVQLVADRKIEVGFIGAETNNSRIENRAVTTDELVLAAPAEFGQARIDAGDLKDIPFLLRERGSGSRAAFEKLLAEHGIDLGDIRIAAELGSTESIKRGVAEGMGVSLISRLALKNELAAGTLKTIDCPGLPLKRNIYLITNRLIAKSPICETFVDFALASLT